MRPPLTGLAMADFGNPEHWRSRAEKVRALADEMNDLAAKAMMLRVAENYERFAVRAEQQLQDQKPAA
jgi:hypothetical protein